MKKTTLVCGLAVICFVYTSCNSAKYTYLNKVKADKNVVSNYDKKVTTSNQELTQVSEEESTLSYTQNDPEITTSKNSVISEASEISTIIEESSATNSSQKITNEVTVEEEISNTNPEKPNETNKTTDEGGTEASAIVGFVSSLVGLIVLAVPLGIVAIIFSAIGLKKTSTSGKKGRGLAIAGLIIGIIDVIFGLILIARVI
jgi:cobalamin biosynthesis Mg chelatase CobN